MIHKSKSRVRFQHRTEKVKQDSGSEKTKREPKTTVFRSAPVVINNGPRFAKLRIPSADEQGDLFRSNLSSSLSAVKANDLARQRAGRLPLSPARQHFERIQEEDDDPPASLLMLAPLYVPDSDGYLVAQPSTDRSGGDDGPCASLLATSIVQGSLKDDIEAAGLGIAVVERADEATERPILRGVKGNASSTKKDERESQQARTVFHGSGNGARPKSLLATASTLAEPNTHLEQVDITAADIWSVKEATVKPERLLAEISHYVGYTKPLTRTLSAPVQGQRHRSTLLQRVVSLFAGRRQHAATEEASNSPVPSQGESEGPAAPSQQPHPLTQATVSNGCTAPRRIPRLNLPLPNPVMASRRPYLPIEEALDAPFVFPAREHPLTGTYYVHPDIFTPAEIQVGFPSHPIPVGVTPTLRKSNSCAKLLDRDDAVWGKYYAKHPTAEHLPFSKSYIGLHHVDELTEQQFWDAHAARHAQFRKADPKPVTDEDRARQADDEEHERAERLRHHAGHCFGALTGDVYPFHGGHII
ncbi:hypothetical protein C7974DRAFT_418477 [Boeremia exigua]|uniref:uncharacterized protein n=1 Tax=Boeremia exigua TaxID=749465 RepID=UPI001E8E2CAC|nr:uncharacterized protein C7974DRAFT_418477 [Boeremia exigua]KAH6612530.1 hypothetical protein C7974DRAFT_418477 [Boeremia exigua]